MNTLETKCEILKQTPQTRWFDLRYKAIFMQLQNMGLGGLPIEAILPGASMANLLGYIFEYDNEYYFLFICKVGGTIECFHLERTNSHYGGLLTSHIVLSSDDDPHEDTWLPQLCLAHRIPNTTTLMSKCKAAFDACR